MSCTTDTADHVEAIETFTRLFDEMTELQNKADAAFARYFAKRQSGEPTNGAAWQRLENQVSYLSTDVYRAASRLYTLDIDPESLRPDYMP